MIAEFDCGNSSIKWRVLDRDGVRVEGGRAISFEALVENLAQYSFDQMRAVSVAASAQDELMSERLKACFGLDLWFARTVKSCAGLRNSYEFPERMGADRWLAMLAARAQTPLPVLVFDLGSAFTADLVDGSGRHVGGYIMPGIPLMEQGLFGNTGKVRPWGEESDTELGPGTSTGKAVYRGCRNMLHGACAELITRAGEFSSDFAVIITGGDSDIAEYVCRRENVNYKVIPELVLDGLAISWKGPNVE